MKNAGYSEKEIMEKKVAGLFKEAYKQGALLTHSKLHSAPCFYRSISKRTKTYMEEQVRCYQLEELFMILEWQ